MLNIKHSSINQRNLSILNDKHENKIRPSDLFEQRGRNGKRKAGKMQDQKFKVSYIYQNPGLNNTVVSTNRRDKKDEHNDPGHQLLDEKF